MKIGILTHNYPRNKKERKDAGVFLMDFASELSKKSSVVVFSPNFGGLKESYAKIPVTWFSWDGPAKKFGDWNVFSPISVWYFFKLLFVGAKKAVDFARTEKLDYSLAAWSIPSGIYAYWVKKVLGTPYGVWNLGSDINKYIKFPILKQLIVLSLKNADHVFANSLDLVKKVGEFSGRNVYLLPAVTKFKKVVANSKIKKSNKFKFLFVGRLEKVKGPDILIQATKLLMENNSKLNFSVDILGGGSMESQLKEKIKTYNLSEVVQMRGWANEAEVSKFMSSNDCLLVPSRSESLPLVILEAAKSNLPVIASNVGDCSFLIKKYKIGFSFENQDIKGLADCMEKIVNSKNFNKSGFLRLVRDYSLEKTVQLFTEKVAQLVRLK